MASQVRTKEVLYEFNELLGVGANSCVYKAFQTDRGRQIRHPVALKILNSEISVDEWRGEFESLMRVCSQHCVRIFGFDRIEGKPALVLEWIDGITLFELIKKGRLSQAAAEEVLLQIQSGLMDLNLHGLFHGDLSPNNVIIDTTGLVKLLDFGRANYLEDKRRATHEFAAPEVLMGAAPNLENDLFSLSLIARWISKEGKVNLSNAWFSRKAVYQSNSISARRELSRLVKRARLKKSSAPTTENILHIRAQGAPTRRQRSWIALLLLAFLAGQWPHTEAKGLKSGGSIGIRSNFAVEIHLDGRLIGYAPVDLIKLPEGVHTIEWRSSQGAGVRSLTLRSWEHIILDDRELF